MEYELTEEDKELVSRISGQFGLSLVDAEVLVRNTILPWINEQIPWGGKYDYLLEGAAGPDT